MCNIVHVFIAKLKMGINSDHEANYTEFTVCILLEVANGNEGSGEVEVCLFPWSKENLPNAEDIITLFHFNPEMSKDPLVDNELPEDEDDEDDDDHVTSWNTLRALHDCGRKIEGTAFFDWLQKKFTPFVRIAIGCESMNPVPCFILAHVAPGWVGGVLTTLAKT